MKKALLFLFTVLAYYSSLFAQSVSTIAGNGTGAYTGDGGSAVSAELNSPDAVKFDHAGNLYVADQYNNVIRKISTTGIITTVAGANTGGTTGDDIPATNASLRQPGDLCFDAAGNLYISNYGGEDIRKVDATGIITTIAGIHGVVGYNGDNIPATAAQLNDPAGLVFDNDGNLCFSDFGNHRVRKINMVTGIITTIAGNGTGGYFGDGIPATDAELRYPGYLAISPSGELCIPDYPNHVIRKIDHSGIITTIAGTPTVSGYTGDGGQATAAELTSCFAILFDPAGNMYLSDRDLGVIRKINTAGIITTIAGIGTLGYGGDGGPATAAQFNQDMYCSAIDAYGNLYVADPLNNRVRKISYSSLGVQQTAQPDMGINISPNPATNEVVLSAAVELKTITVLDAQGRQVRYIACNNTHTTIDIADLPKGVYFVKVNGVYGGQFVKE